jgi:HPt (histidine-containing phosphotransfer) domain-containing protein
MAKRDITGAVDFGYLEGFAQGDQAFIDEVLELFREQAEIWRQMIDPTNDNWRDAVHALKGSARGVGAFRLGEICELAEAAGPLALSEIHTALDAALFDIAAYTHEQALKSLKN